MVLVANLLQRKFYNNHLQVVIEKQLGLPKILEVKNIQINQE